MQDDPAFGMNAEMFSGSLVVHGQVCRRVCCVRVLRTVCTALAECKSGAISDIFHISFFANRSHKYYSPSSHLFSRFVACLDVFGSGSIVVTCFTFFEATNGSLHFILCELWYFICYLIDMAFSFDIQSS